MALDSGALARHRLGLGSVSDDCEIALYLFCT